MSADRYWRPAVPSARVRQLPDFGTRGERECL